MSKQPKPKSTTKKTSSSQNLPAARGGKIPKDYKAFLKDLKIRIRSSQLRAAVKVNEELIKLYWEIGREISEKQETGGWGANIVEKLAKDLQSLFPGIEGFSRTNIFRMRAFYLAYKKIPQAVGQIDDLSVFRIPWGHNALILEKVKNLSERLWYAQQTIQNGWSRSSLEDWIKADLYKKKGFQ